MSKAIELPELIKLAEQKGITVFESPHNVWFSGVNASRRQRCGGDFVFSRAFLRRLKSISPQSIKASVSKGAVPKNIFRKFLQRIYPTPRQLGLYLQKEDTFLFIRPATEGILFLKSHIQKLELGESTRNALLGLLLKSKARVK